MFKKTLVLQKQNLNSIMKSECLRGNGYFFSLIRSAGGEKSILELYFLKITVAAQQLLLS